MIVILSLRCSLSYFQQCELFGTISIVIASSKNCITCSHWSILYNGIFCLHWDLNEDCYFQIVWFRFSVVSLVPRRKSPRDSMGWKAMIFKVHSNPNHSTVLQLQTKGTRTGRAWDLLFRMTEPRAMGTAHVWSVEKRSKTEDFGENRFSFVLALMILLKDLINAIVKPCVS